MSAPAGGPAGSDGGPGRIDTLTVVVAVGTIMVVSALAAAVQTAWVLDVVGHDGTGIPTGRRMTANLVEAAVAAGALVGLGVHRHPRFVRQLADVAVAGVVAALARVATQFALGMWAGRSYATLPFQLGAGLPMAWIAGGFALLALWAQRRVRLEAAEAARAAVAHGTVVRALQDEEVRVRREVAEGLHGTAQQRLVLVVAGLDHVVEQLEGRVEPTLTDQLRDLRDRVETVRGADIRRASRLLYPHQIDIGVVPAVRALLADVPAAVSTRLTVDPELGPLDDPAGHGPAATPGERLLVARVVEEAIGNALRHGRATSLAVSLALDGPRLVVTVTDDGRGFGEQQPGGSGLARLSTRLRLAGGALSVAPAPGGGVAVRARVPVAALVEDADPRPVAP